MKCIVCETEYGDSGLCPRCGYDRSVDFIAVRSLSVPDAASRYVRSNNLRFADNIMNSKRNDEQEHQQELPKPEKKPEESKEKKKEKKKRLWLLALIPLLLLGAYSIAYAVCGGWVRTEYDGAGNAIKKTRYNYFGVIDCVSKYEYYSNGSVLNEHEYDSAGNRTKETRYKADGSVDYWYEYEYDSAGNWTNTTKYNGDGSVGGSR